MYKSCNACCILMLLSVLFNWSSNTITQKGKIAGIIDGDSYGILLKVNKPVCVRMEDINAPGKEYHFTTLCFDKQVVVKITGTDIHTEYLLFLTGR